MGKDQAEPIGMLQKEAQTGVMAGFETLIKGGDLVGDRQWVCDALERATTEIPQRRRLLHFGPQNFDWRYANSPAAPDWRNIRGCGPSAGDDAAGWQVRALRQSWPAVP